MVKWRSVDSSAVKRFGYSPDDNSLVVETTSDCAYMYEVTEEMMASFLMYDSIGKAYNELIRGEATQIAKGHIEIENGDPQFHISKQQRA